MFEIYDWVKDLGAGVAGWNHDTAVITHPSPTVVAGAKPIGTTNYTVPVGSNFVAKNGSDATGTGSILAPYATVQKAVDSSTAGKTIVLRGGTYSEYFTNTKNLIIQAYPNEAVWFTGARKPTTWTNNGNGTWKTSYNLVLARFTPHAGTNPLRNYSDQAWANDVLLTQIASGVPTASQFVVDQTAKTLTIGRDPNGQNIEISDLRTAALITGVTKFYGIGFEKFSPDGMEWLNSIITFAGNSNGSIVENCVFQKTAMAALSVIVPDVTVRNCTLQDAGWTLVGGNLCDRMLIKQCIIRRCNQNGWSPEPACAGVKLTRCDQIKMTQNWVESISGVYGLWLDVFCTRYEISLNVIKGDPTTAVGKINTGIHTELGDGGFMGGVQYRGLVVGNRVLDVTGNGIMALDNGWNRTYNNEVLRTSVPLYLWQDNRYNTGGDIRTASEVPSKTLHTEVCNNHTSSGIGYNIQFAAYDDGGVVNLKGGDMVDKFGGNWFEPTFTGSNGSMTQWGAVGGSRTSVNTIAGLSTLSSTYGGPLGAKLGANYLGSTPPDANAVAVPLPADVAAILGVPAGTKIIGPNPDLLPVVTT